MSLTLTKFYNAAKNQGKRLCTILAYGRDDVRTAQEVGPYGTDSNPIPEMLAIYGSTSVNGKGFILGYLNKQQIAETGEHRIYSTDAEGNLKTYVWLKNDGNLLLAGDDDHAVRYSKLEEAFNQLKGDFNDLVSNYNNMVSTFNSHVHQYIDTGAPPTPPSFTSPTATPGSNGSPSTADITPAKIEQIKVPLNNPES